MEELQTFRHTEFGELNVLEIDGKTYFPATGCARILGYAHPRDAIRRHCRDAIERTTSHPQSPKKAISMYFIPESDLLRLITHSKLHSADRFESWILHEILPAVQKKENYDPTTQQMIEKTTSEVLKKIIPFIIAEMHLSCITPQAEMKVLKQSRCRIKSPKCISCHLDTASTRKFEIMAYSNGHTSEKIRTRGYLRSLRSSNGYSQQDVANVLGMTRQNYSLIEQGKRQQDISLTLLEKLAQCFHMSIKDLIEAETNYRNGG